VQSPSGARYGGALDWEAFLRLGDGVSDEALAERPKGLALP